jgi:type II secretory pathway component PulM
MEGAGVWSQLEIQILVGENLLDWLKKIPSPLSRGSEIF